MLTAKQNMREVVLGKNPERYVNQYEALTLLFHPFILFSNPIVTEGMMNIPNAWGVYNSFPKGTPGNMPVHTPDKILIKDITHWRDYVHAPSLDFTDEQWAIAKGMYDEVDGNLTYKASFVYPGLFEQTHHMSEICNALMYYVTNPKEMHDLIKYLTEFELELAEGICSHLHPDAVFHHDDWGTETSTFLNPAMFDEFFVEPYKQIYGYYHDHGVELVVHHSDCFAATLVPSMIEMGIDIWQGCMRSNDVPELVKKYGGQISFMGDIDNKDVDFDGWTREDCRKTVRRAMDNNPNRFFIPCISQGGPGSVYPGAYAIIAEEIDAYNEELFGFKAADSASLRLPLQVLF